MVTCSRIKLDPYLSLCTQINSHWVKDLSVKPETPKVLEQKVGSMPQYTVCIGKDIINWTLFVQETRLTIDKWDFMKLTGF